MEEDLFVRLLNFGVNRKEGFNLEEIFRSLELNEEEKEVIKKYCENAFKNELKYRDGGYPNLETPFLLIESGEQYDSQNTKYLINLDSKFRYIEYLELKESRINANKARRLSWVAIGISILSIATSILVSLYITQEVKIKENQLQKIKQTINKD